MQLCCREYGRWQINTMESNLKGKKSTDVREKKLATLMIMPVENVGVNDCPLREFLGKLFMERIFWLENQTRSKLSYIIEECETCQKCSCGRRLSEIN